MKWFVLVAAGVFGSAGPVAAQYRAPQRPNHIQARPGTHSGTMTGHNHTMTGRTGTTTNPYTAGVVRAGGYSPYTAGAVPLNNGYGGFTPGTSVYPGFNYYNPAAWTGTGRFASGSGATMSGWAGR